LGLLSLLVAVALFAQTTNSVFEIELWPGEGRPRFEAVAGELAIREAPSLSAKVVRRLPVTKGQQVAFDETLYRTIEAGHLEAVAVVNISGRVLGTTRLVTRDAYYKGQFPERAVTVKAGDVVEYLQYRAEGTCFVRVADQVIDADPCPAEDARAFRVMSQAKTEWWIRLVSDRVPLGWVVVDGTTVKESGRSF
jgi:hypothetical protein